MALMSASLREFIGHIIIRGLPNDVKNQFFDITASLYPDYNAILSKVDKVIEKLNRIGLNTKDSTMKQNPNNSNSNSSKAQSINSATSQSSKNSKAGYKGNKNKRGKKCRFCQCLDHLGSDCLKYSTQESRIAVLKGIHGDKICHKCTHIHTGECKDKFTGYCIQYKSCKENLHHFTICPIKCKALMSKPPH